jgi:hypothetical protein
MPHGANLAMDHSLPRGLGRLSHRRFHFEWAEGPGTATAGDCHRKGPAPASPPFFKLEPLYSAAVRPRNSDGAFCANPAEYGKGDPHEPG